MKQLGRKCNKLYDILDISRHATVSEIKRAYYKKAKQLHPDQGGNAREFNVLHNAYLTLSDPYKKRRYDQTGEHVESTVAEDAALKQAANELIAMKFDSLLKQEQMKIIFIDIVAAIKSSIEADTRKMKENLTGIKETIKFLKKLGGKIKFKGNEINMMEAMIMNMIMGNERNIEKINRQIKCNQMALKLIKHYNFNPDQRQQGYTFVQSFAYTDL